MARTSINNASRYTADACPASQPDRISVMRTVCDAASRPTDLSDTLHRTPCMRYSAARLWRCFLEGKARLSSLRVSQQKGASCAVSQGPGAGGLVAAAESTWRSPRESLYLTALPVALSESPSDTPTHWGQHVRCCYIRALCHNRCRIGNLPPT